MSQSAAQAATFYKEAAAEGRVWTVRDNDGYPAPLTSSGQRAQPFWSSLRRAERIIQTVPAYRGFSAMEIGLDAFFSRWVPGLAKDGILMGVNWSGDAATGYDIPSEEVAANIKYFLPAGP